MSDMEERARLEQEIEQMRAMEALRTQGPLGEAVANVFQQARAIQEMLRPEIHVDQPPALVLPAPEVRVDVPVPEIRVEVPVPEVRVDVADQSAAIMVLSSAVAELVSAVQAWMTYEMSEREKTVTFTRNPAGLIVSATVTEA